MFSVFTSPFVEETTFVCCRYWSMGVGTSDIAFWFFRSISLHPPIFGCGWTYPQCPTRRRSRSGRIPVSRWKVFVCLGFCLALQGAGDHLSLIEFLGQSDWDGGLVYVCGVTGFVTEFAPVPVTTDRVSRTSPLQRRRLKFGQSSLPRKKKEVPVHRSQIQDPGQ